MSLCLFISCKSPIENPESLDPIYKDLLSLAEAHEKAAEKERGEIEKIEQEIAALEPRDPSKGMRLRDKYKRERNLVQQEQRATYYKVRAEQRKDFDQKSYLKAFKADQPWPDPKEYAQYQLQRELERKSRNWDDRVPKTTRYNRAPAGEEKKEKPKPKEH